jgi:hypothetical protein
MKNLSSKIALANFIRSPSKLISFKFILVQAVSLKSLFSSFYPIAGLFFQKKILDCLLFWKILGMGKFLIAVA